VDYRPFNANSKISFLNGGHIITKTGAKHIILADGVSGFDELNGLLVSKYSTGDEGAEIKQ